MPAASVETGYSAFKQVANGLDGLEASAGARETDLAFLKEFMKNEAIHNLVLAHDKLEVHPSEAESAKSEAHRAETLKVIEEIATSDQDAEELAGILQDFHLQLLLHRNFELDRNSTAMIKLHNQKIKNYSEIRGCDEKRLKVKMKSLLLAHDEIAVKNFEEEYETQQLDSPPPPVFSSITDSIRLVRIRKNKNEPLGITVKLDDNNDLIVARIITGSMIAKQGLLHEGDVIKEVNSIPVQLPEQLMDIIKNSNDGIMLKIWPNLQRQSRRSDLFIKAHFNYDPYKDRLIPCKEAGLAFRDGDILEILCNDDANWWQARKVSGDSVAGIIPSRSLEEKRKAFVSPEYDYSKSFFCGFKRKKKIKYNTKNNKDYDKCEIMIYEEVIKMPPFQRKTLVLVGATGVGRRSLKERLIKSDPTRFAAVMPHTSRAPREGEVHGQGYFFMEREAMEEDIQNEKFLEHGEFNGNLYGTQIESIFQVIRSSKMCVLDINPTSLKILKTPEFMPYIVFIAAPNSDVLRKMYENGRRATNYKRGGRPAEVKSEEDFLEMVEESMQIEQVYKSYFDLTIINDDFNESFETLRRAVDELSHETQWVPLSWVY